MQTRLLLLLSVLAAPRPSRADPAPVALDVSSCPDLSVDRIKRVLAVEVRARVVDGDVAPAGGRHVLVSCSGERAELRTEEPASGARLERTLDLSATVAVARPRLVALAAAELLGALTGQPAPVLGPAPPAPAPAALTVGLALPAEGSRQGDRWKLLALGHARGRAGTGPGLGAGVRVARVWTALVLQAEVIALRAWAADGAGRVQVDELEAGVLALARRALGGWSVAGGAGARLGAARLRGRPADAVALQGRVLTAPTGGVLLTGVITVPPVAHVRGTLALEAGRVLLPVRGQVDANPEAAVAAAIDGFWIGASIGLGIDLP